MLALKIAVAVAWIAFGLYWLVSGTDAKKGTRHWQGVQFRVVLAAAVVLLVRFVQVDGLEVNLLALGILGAAVVVCGLGFAVWARVHLGHNWGMPMTTKAEPELITSGPYRFVRHPIYTGLLAVSDHASVLRDWLLVLGFTEDLLIPGEEEGLVHHCQLDWPEGGRVLLSSTGERSTPCRAGTSSLHVVTSDPDAVLERALKAGATVVHPLVDQTDYPSRDFTVADPDGNHWTFATFAG